MTPVGTAPRPLSATCRVVALFGGALLVGVMAIVVTSVSGRALVSIGLGPIPGDFELVEIGTALAVFCFLPWCQLTRGHVSVDLLATLIGPRIDAALRAAWDLAMTAVAALILWRLWAGMQDKLTYGETSFILQLPVWWAYAACLPFAALFVVASAWTAWSSVRSLRASTGGSRRV